MPTANLHIKDQGHFLRSMNSLLNLAVKLGGATLLTRVQAATTFATLITAIEDMPGIHASNQWVFRRLAQHLKHARAFDMFGVNLAAENAAIAGLTTLNSDTVNAITDLSYLMYRQYVSTLNSSTIQANAHNYFSHPDYV
jgi:hypothetical protein